MKELPLIVYSTVAFVYAVVATVAYIRKAKEQPAPVLPHEPEPDREPFTRCPSLHGTKRCSLQIGHDGPCGSGNPFVFGGESWTWWHNELTPSVEWSTIYAIYSDGLLISATARPLHAQAMARLGHEVRAVPFERERAARIESVKESEA